VLTRNLNLVLPDKHDMERDQVAEAWTAQGGIVTRLGRFWDPPALDPRAVRIYANDTFALVVAQKLNLSLVSPDDDLLARLPSSLLKREITIRQLGDSSAWTYPAFIKPVVPKQFRAAVYNSASALTAECSGLDPHAPVYVSEVVVFSSEVRGFILSATVQDASLYEGAASLEEARLFLDVAARHESLPPTCVVDVGYIEGRGWAVIEANAAWGAGLNGCAPSKVLGCIANATRYAA
jgi:hypothetical protein